MFSELKYTRQSTDWIVTDTHSNRFATEVVVYLSSESSKQCFDGFYSCDWSLVYCDTATLRQLGGASLAGFQSTIWKSAFGDWTFDEPHRDMFGMAMTLRGCWHFILLRIDCSKMECPTDCHCLCCPDGVSQP